MTKEKKKQASLPSAEPIPDEMEKDSIAVGGAVDEPGTPVSNEPAIVAVKVESATITFPLVPFVGAYARRCIDIRNLTERQAVNLQRLVRGMEDSGLKLANGAFVRREVDAIRYLLEQIG